MSKRDMVIFLFKWKWTIGSSFLVVVACVTLLVYLLPQTYVASAMLLVERNRPPNVGADSAASFRVLEMAEVMNTAVQIVSSRTIMEQVVERLKLHERPSRETRETRPSSGWLVAVSRFVQGVRDGFVAAGLVNPPLSPRENWIEALMQSVRARPSVDSNIFTISYRSADPHLAAEVVRAVTDAYLVHYLKIYSHGGASDFFRDQVEQAQQTLTRLRAALDDYKTKGALAAVSMKQQELVKEMRGLQEQAGNLNNEHGELLTRYTTQHPKVVLLQTRMTSAKNRMAHIQEQLQALEKSDVRTQEMVLAIKAQEERYLSYVRQHETAKLGDASNVNLMNVRVVDYPHVPMRPSVSRLFYIGIAILGGGLIGLAIAMIREYYDRRVSTPDLAEQVLGVPTFGCIENIGWWRR